MAFRVDERDLSLHGQLNRALRPLAIVCDGYEGSRIYFRSLKRGRSADALAGQIISTMDAIPGLWAWIGKIGITKFSLRG